MNVDLFKNVLEPKSCFYCLNLRTGCYIIGGLYWLLGALLSFDELKYAIRKYSRAEDERKLGVIFFYDVNPTIFVVFTSCLFYGLFKENLLLIFPTYAMLLSIEFELCFHMITYYFSHHYLPPFFFIFCTMTLNAYMVIILYAHVKNVWSKNKAGQIISNSFTEFENQNCA